MRFRLCAAGAVLLGVAACGQKTTADPQESAADAQATATASPAAAGETGVAAGEQLPLTAEAFVAAAAAGDLFEIQSSRNMQAAGPPVALRGYTQKMIADHQTSLTKLKTATNFAPATPDNQALTDQQKAALDALREAGPNKVALYLQQQVAAHEKHQAILKTYAASGDNPALMRFAAEAVPMVTHHLEEAKALQRQFAAKP